MLKLGDRVKFIPMFACERSDPKDKRNKAIRRTYEGTVIYIHPRRRFYMVEAMLPGGVVKETLYFEEVGK